MLGPKVRTPPVSGGMDLAGAYALLGVPLPTSTSLSPRKVAAARWEAEEEAAAPGPAAGPEAARREEVVGSVTVKAEAGHGAAVEAAVLRLLADCCPWRRRTVAHLVLSC